ncbi:hypothetical protein DEU56DRAFT_905154 [Suillus clintonianus]|uniref:uncharacterized protein n=1 Tax=Suillus clintonianus TaxID=1904413 RepID=UPI001B880C7B|nr:uncharacterized protein DEU56DRAFT_905154 [Suillus clintonianus]KAG2116781.1 hypothetical protein DEU56DRAFT_905154 [Suillus clintonianus]
MSDSSGSQYPPVARLPLTPEQRDEFNQVILKNWGPQFINSIAQSDPTRWDEDKGIITIASMMIVIIIEHAQGLLQRLIMKSMTFWDITPILQEDLTLRGIIYDACRNRSFSHIADLEIFQIPKARDLHMLSAQDKDFLDSFSRPYVGKAVDGFYEYLKENNIKFKGVSAHQPYYAKFCSIVQSSGTGKSRLLTELRNRGVIVLYMNIREPSDAGFPNRDAVPARILTEEMDCTRAEYGARCCALFTAIFKVLRQRLSNKHRLGSDSLIKSWNDEMCDMHSEARSEFFEEVQYLYEQTLDTIRLMNPTMGGGLALKDDVPAPNLEGESFVEEAYENMLTAMPDMFAEKDEDYPKLVISFDEAYSLSKMSSKGFRPSHILGRVINCYSEGEDTSVWVVFASTTPHVVDFLAPPVIHDSQRVAVGGHLLFPPYTYLGWDQNADRLSDIPANDAGKFKHIVGFGRPLWKSLAGKRSVADILELAALKLCKSNTYVPSDTNQALAVLSQRFGLDICFGHPDAASYVETGVASHLRICFSTTQDRSSAYTGYPSEPLLSCVAADLLHSGTTSLEGALGVLNKKVDEGMVEIGQSGELVSRLVLLLAKDMYVRGHLSEGTIRDLHYEGSGDAELIDCQKVSVVDFLQYLFGETFWLLADEEAKTNFRHAYINFSHWVSMTELISPGPGPGDSKQPTSDMSSAKEWTLRHWVRTSAVQCCDLQPLVDKMIPIYFDDPTLDSDDLKRVSQIFISDKAGKNPNARELAAITRKHDSIRCLSTLPYIAIRLDFNVEPQLKVTFPERDPNDAETDRSLRIYASGLEETTFPFLTPNTIVASQLRGLISREETPTQTNLDALVEFGSTAKLRNLQWETQD